MSGGWWRRNRWGLIVLVPVLAATIGLNWGDAYDKYWRSQPHEPVKASDDGWVSFAGARMRLTDLGPGTDLAVFGGDLYKPPAGTAVWRAKLSFDAPKPDDLGGCGIELEDASSRRYEASPAELTNTRAGFVSCTPDFSDDGKTKYERTAYFLTPAGIRPVAVRITLLTKNPRYARLTL